MQRLYFTLISLVLLFTPALASESPNDTFKKALEQENIVRIHALLKCHDLNVNLQDEFGSTVLMVAIIQRHITLVRQLLKRDDIDVNLQNGFGSTALTLAIVNNYVPVTELLLAHNSIKVNVQNECGSTALMLAIDHNHITIAKLLLQRNDINVNLQNNCGFTALMLAIEENRITIAELLLQRDDIDVNLQNWQKKSALSHIEGQHIDFEQPQDDKLYYVDLVKRTQVPSLDKNHALLQLTYLQALYAQQPCSQAMKLYRDILLINKLSHGLEEKQKTVFYQGCLTGYESKNSHYSIEAKDIDRAKKPSHYQPVLDADLICLLAGYLREIAMKGVSDRSDWVHIIRCYLWANNAFALQHNPTTNTLQEIHFWHKEHSPYTEFLDVANRTQERALFKVVDQQGVYEAVATKHLARGLKQKNIIQNEDEIFEKSITALTPIIVAGLNALAHQLAASS